MTPQEVKGIRKSYGMTQAAFAQFVGVKVMTVYTWETGRRKIPKMLDILIQLIEKTGSYPLSAR